MRTLIHLSDIHFGKVDYTLIPPLVSLVNELRPDLVAVSGDFTQRARSSQFIEAAQFLKKLPTPQIVVPGNHDIPLYNPLARFGSPLTKYRRYISSNLEPFFSDNEIAVAGINTARSFTHKSGRINRSQVARVVKRFAALPPQVFKIIVTHHPFDLPPGHTANDVLGRAHMAMAEFATARADLFLSGHLHISHTSQSAQRYKIEGHSALVVQVGTTTSTRGRGHANAFNKIHLHWPRISIERFEWQPTQLRFTPASHEHFQHVSGKGWSQAPASPPP